MSSIRHSPLRDRRIPDGKDITTAKGLRQVNPRHVITRELDLKPGDEQEITCTRQVYIRN
ncbi:MAG: hypothetical protein ABIF71_04975 [Planctomycetota bacterium]